MSNGEAVAIAKRSIAPILNGGVVRVYRDKELFGLWEDAFDLPIFFYPFADGQRFLCDYDFDTAMLVFVVDSNPSNADKLDSDKWPSDVQLRENLARMATNVVLETRCLVRLPTYAELQEVSNYLAGATSGQIKAGSFPFCDLGLYRSYATKKDLQLDFAADRQSYWPLAK